MSTAAKTNIKATLALLAATTFALAGCSPQSGPTARPEPTPVYVTAPLTGVQYLENSVEAAGLSRPSVACKIDNSYDARPQLGLNRTDVTFVEMVEGGLTRLVAIWHSDQPNSVGPVRSIRPMDPDIISPFGGIVCYSGGQAVFVNMMRNTNVFNASETSEQDNGTFSRSKDRFAPHNVLVDVAKLATNHPELAAPAVQFGFAKSLANSTAALQGKPVSDIKVYFALALSQWAPNAEASRFLRTQDEEIHTDAADGSQISAANVVIMTVEIDRSYLGGRYSNVPKSVMIGSGQAQVCSAGSCVVATWSKASQIAPITFTDAAGNPVLLAPGNTWVELQAAVPESKTVLTFKPLPSATPTPK
jgi:hypothetical protein